MKFSYVVVLDFLRSKKKLSPDIVLTCVPSRGSNFGAWVGCRFIAGGSTAYVGYFNCLVHILMYSYYLLSVVDNSYRNSILFKNQITHIQLLQFGLIFFLNAMILINSDCTFPKPISLILLPQNIFMFLMFGDFYVRAYILPKRKNMQVKK